MNSDNPTLPYGYGKQTKLFVAYKQYTKGLFNQPQEHGRHKADLALMHGAFRPHPDLAQMIQSTQTRMLETPPLAAGSPPPTGYMCLHARIQPDMQHDRPCKSQKETRLANMSKAFVPGSSRTTGPTRLDHFESSLVGTRKFHRQSLGRRKFARSQCIASRRTVEWNGPRPGSRYQQFAPHFVVCQTRSQCGRQSGELSISRGHGGHVPGERQGYVLEQELVWLGHQVEETKQQLQHLQATIHTKTQELKRLRRADSEWMELKSGELEYQI